MSEIYERKGVKWLVMLYLSGDNNLSPEMVWTINEIRTTGVPEGFALTIQFDGLTPGSPTVRYAIDETTHVDPGPSLGPIPFPEAKIEELREDDAGAPEVLADFIQWSTKRYQARYRMLVLSGHGSGSVGDFLSDDQARRELQPGAMSIPGVAQAITIALQDDPYLVNEDKAVHILGLDSCLMSTLEVASELKGLVSLLVASEGFVPNSGWPYGYLLEQLKARVGRGESVDPEAISTYLVRDCAEYYSTYLSAGVSFDISSCDIDRIDYVRTAVELLASELLPSFHERGLQDAAVLAHWRAQSFKWEQYVDLWDFCGQLKRQVDGLGAACENVMTRIIDATGGRDSTAAVIAHETVGIDFQHAHGLSIFFPWSIPKFEDPDWLQFYGELKFAKESGWLEFLKRYAAVTMREPAELRTKEPVVEWPDGRAAPVTRAVRRPVAAGVKGSVNGLGSIVSPAVSPQPGVKVSSQVHTKVSSQVHTKGIWPVITMKNPPQTVKIPQRLLARRGAAR
jgi:Clostripain family